MKVVMIAFKIFPDSKGGMERYATFLANHLVRLGIQVDMVCGQSPSKNEGVPLDFNIVSVGWCSSLPDFVANCLFSARAARVIRQNNYDVAYGHNMGLFGYSWHKTIPCVMSPHGLEVFKENRPGPYLRAGPRRAAKRYIARRCERVISEGGKLTQEIERYLKVPPERIAVIPNGVDLAYIDKCRSHANGGEKIPKSFLYVGRLTWNKGLRYLLEAFAQIPEYSGACLFIIGDGPMREEIERTKGDNVVLLGRVSEQELFSWYSKAEVFVFPTLWEGMPTVVLEAMASRLPILSTDIGAVATMVDSNNGFCIPPADTQAIVESIEGFLHMTAQQKAALGQRSYEKVVRRFTWSRVAQDTAALFETLLSSRRSA